MGELKKLQKEIFENKKAKGFNTTDVNFEFNLIYGELAEAFQAYRKKSSDLREELADVVIYLLGLSEMLDIDLEKEVLKKVEKNKKREYQKTKGANIRTKDV